MEKYVNCQTKVPDQWLVIGLPVVAAYSTSEWCRAVITKVDMEGQHVLVTWMDYGGSNVVRRDDVLLMQKEDLIANPALAIKVAMFGIVASNVSNGEFKIKSPYDSNCYWF